MIDMVHRLAAIVEDAFDDDVKLVARTVSAKVTGGMKLDKAAESFAVALDELFQIRKALLNKAADRANGET